MRRVSTDSFSNIIRVTSGQEAEIEADVGVDEGKLHNVCKNIGRDGNLGLRFCRLTKGS